MSLAEASRVYQIALEHRRAARDRLEGVLSMAEELEDAESAFDEERANLKAAYKEHHERRR